jgi:hypothetical protein
MSTYQETRRFGSPAIAAGQTSKFLNAVYGWMSVGLAITAAVAWVTASSPAVIKLIDANGPVFWLLAFLQLGIVFYLSSRVRELSATTAAELFFLYSALTGVTLSFVLLAFTGESIAATFLVSGGAFAGLALYGTMTRRRLAGLGQFLFMGLIGVVLASIVGIFWHSGALQFVLSIAGVIVFAGLTAYDAQRLAEMAREAPPDSVQASAIVGALALYLDFINLFLFLLRFTGSRRQQS